MPCLRSGPCSAQGRAVVSPPVVAAGAERLMGSSGSAAQPPPLLRGRLAASQLAQLAHRRRWMWSNGFARVWDGDRPPATAVPSSPGMGRGLQAGMSQPAGQGELAGPAGQRRGCHGRSIPPAALWQARRALACGDDGADDALGLRRKAEKSCHGDRRCHFKEARSRSHPSLPEEPRPREARGASGSDPPGGLAGPQRCHLT